jgi:hypothetical protein
MMAAPQRWLWKAVRDWPAAKSLAIRHERNAADVLLVSFPKCGRTWLRLLIGRAVQQHFRLGDANLLELHKLAGLHPDIPRIYVTHEDMPQVKRPAELATSKRSLRRKKIIFLARDPRDVIVSTYFQWRERRRRAMGDMTSFIRQEAGGYETVLRYYAIWEANRGVVKDFLLIRYEDMRQDARRELRRVLDFLGLPGVAEAVVAEAVEFASFENMRKMETEDRFQSRKLRAADAQEAESFKTRRGKVGGYADYLAPDDVEYLNRRMVEVLPDFYGYRP